MRHVGMASLAMQGGSHGVACHDAHVRAKWATSPVPPFTSGQPRLHKRVHVRGGKGGLIMVQQREASWASTGVGWWCSRMMHGPRHHGPWEAACRGHAACGCTTTPPPCCPTSLRHPQRQPRQPAPPQHPWAIQPFVLHITRPPCDPAAGRGERAAVAGGTCCGSGRDVLR
jgi:hypothetical protein